MCRTLPEMLRDRNSLGTFLPMDRRVAIAHGAPLPARVQGAALLGDLSGFTALTRAFVAAYGAQRGAEEMRQTIDGMVRPLLDAVHEARGAVIGFTGDGLTCWFDDDDGRRALSCGLRMQAVTAAAPAVTLPDGGAHAMRLKIAVSAGPARRAVVGDPAVRLVDTLVGGTLDRVASAEALAEPGEVVSDALTLDALGAEVTRGEARGGGAVVTGVREAPEVTPWPAVEAPGDEHAAPWVHPRVRERLRAGDYATELRLLVTVMVRLPRLDFDADAGAVDALDAWVRHLQHAAESHGGALFDLVVGDKGAYALVCFGAPTAHEDDPARALRAARTIAQGLPQASGLAQVGVATGDCWTGLVGGDALRTYGVLGTDVNLAARLMTLAAPGEVLVTERARAAAPGFSFEPRGAATLKGFGEVGTHRCVGEVTSVRRLARALPMVGRQAERDALAEAIAALAEGRGGALFFEAEPGAGKSRLLQEAVDLAARAGGVRVLVGVGSALEQRTPWHAWRDAIAALLAREGDDALDAEVITRRVRALAPELADLAPLLGPVLGVAMDEGPLVASLAGDGRANRTEEVLAAIVDDAARRGPVMLALDDLQFFDSASLALVRAVRARSPGALAVMAARVVRDPPETLSELRAWAPRVFTLTRLTLEEVSALARVRLGLREIDGEVAAWIHRHADGNPFFTEQLTFALRDSGGLLARDGVAHLHDTLRLGEAHDLPDAIRRVTTSRFDRLPPDTLLTLKVASVVGRVFTPETVRAIHPSPPEGRALVAQLDALCELELMQIEGVSGADRSYGFIHAIACDVAYGLLPFAQRAALHAALARWIESRARGDERARDALLAHHWSRAERPEVALPYLGRAGFAALDASAYREAASLFQSALDGSAAAPALDRARWSRGLGQAYKGLGEHARARAALHQASALLGVTPRTGGAATFWVFVLFARNLLPGRAGRLGREVGAEGERWLEAARVCDTLGLVYYYTGELVESLCATQRGLAFAERAGRAARESDVLPLALTNVGGSFGSIFGMHGVARGMIDEARALADASGRLAARGWADLVLGIYRWKFGDIDALTRGATAADALFARAGERRHRSDAMALRMQAAYTLGRFDELEALARRYGELRLGLGDRGIPAMVLAYEALALIARGEHQAAVERCEHARGILPDAGFAPERTLVQGAYALALARLGRPEALEVLAEGVGLARSPHANLQALPGYDAFAEAAVALADAGVAVPLDASLQTLCASMSRTAFFVCRGWRARAMRFEALRADRRGHGPRAQRLRRDALAVARRYGMALDLARLEQASQPKGTTGQVRTRTPGE